ncbi:MAG: glycoside hydrolase domain-containing protein, partial [Lentisphaerota bacterium]
MLIGRNKIIGLADPFFGNSETTSPISQGIASAWNWRKAQTGNTNPGAVRPFGMVSVCPYSGAYPTGYGVYDRTTSGPAKKLYEHKVASGVTHFHHSGSGDAQFFYNYFRFIPALDVAMIESVSKLVAEEASPGYYGAALPDYGVRCELTTAPKAAYHRYMFQDGKPGTLTIDLTAGGIQIPDFPQYRTVPEEIEAAKISNNIWNGMIKAGGVKIFFHLEIKSPVSSGKFIIAGEIHPRLDSLTFQPAAECNGKQPITGIFIVPANSGTPLEAVIGFSFRSSEQALDNSLSLINNTFENAVAESEKEWLGCLGKFKIEAESKESAAKFYSCLYHSLIKPADCGDESPWWPDDSPFFTDFVTLWDHYKTQLPLVFAVYPERGRRIVKSMLKSIKTHGFFPAGYMLEDKFDKFAGQASALAVITVSDAFFRGLFSPDDWNEIKAAITAEFATPFAAEFIKSGKVHPYSHTIDMACACDCAAAMAELSNDRE